MWGFPKIRSTLLGVPIVRTIIYWGLYWGPLILGNYHVVFGKTRARLGVVRLRVYVGFRVQGVGLDITC